MSAIELLEEQVPRKSGERWGRGKTDEEIAALKAAFVRRACGRCGASWEGSFEETGVQWDAHHKSGCR